MNVSAPCRIREFLYLYDILYICMTKRIPCVGLLVLFPEFWLLLTSTCWYPSAFPVTLQGTTGLCAGWFTEVKPIYMVALTLSQVFTHTRLTFRPPHPSPLLCMQYRSICWEMRFDTFLHLYCLVTFILCILRLEVLCKIEKKTNNFFILIFRYNMSKLMCFDKLYIYSICLVCHCKRNKIWLFAPVAETKRPRSFFLQPVDVAFKCRKVFFLSEFKEPCKCWLIQGEMALKSFCAPYKLWRAGVLITRSERFIGLT